MKNTKTLNLRKGFTLIELLVVITVIAILAAIAVPATTAVLRNARTAESTSNMKQIITGLIGYSVDEGSLPKETTSSNANFRKLFESGQLDGGSEQLFFVSGANINGKKPDNITFTTNTTATEYSATETLIAGNVGYAYTTGLGSGNSGAPIIMDAKGDGNYDKTLRGGDALVGTLSGSILKAKINTAGTGIEAKAADTTGAAIVYDLPSSPVFGGATVTIQQPEA